MDKAKFLVAGLSLLAVAWPIETQAQAPAAAPASPAQVSLADGYVLGPGDVIEISVLGRDDYKPRVQVQADGTITLPLIGTIPVRNETVVQLRDDIKRRLVSGGFFAQPQVNIIVATYASRYVTVLGDVNTPGVVPIDRQYHLSEIIARAGGLKSSGSTTVTLTPTGGTARELSMTEIATGTGDDDPIVNPGDKIYVAPAQTYYISGAVGQPKEYQLDPGLTIRKALAQAGGLTASGSEKHVTLYRKGQVIKSASLDEKVMPGDTIKVGEKFF